LKRVVTLPNESEPDIRRTAAREKRTGKLVVNFHQGTAAGGVQWIEPVEEGRNPLTVEVKSVTLNVK
jgi:hypothetical protein